MERLFVNKTPTDLGVETRQELRAKRTHVQKWRHRTERQQRSAKYRSARGDSYRRIAPALDIAQGEWGVQNQKRSSVSYSKQNEDPGERAQLFWAQDLSEGAMQHGGTRTRQSPGLLSMLDQGDCDPFSMAALSITSWNNHLILHAGRYLLLMVWPVEANMRNHQELATASWHETRDDIADTAQLHAYLAVASSSKRLVQPRCDYLKTEVMTHKAESISSLRRQMATRNQNGRNLATVLHLFTAEWIAQDMFAASVHFGAAKQIIDSEGGLQALQWRRREFVVYCDVSLASRGWHRPLFPAEDWSPGAFPMEMGRLSQENRAAATKHDVDPSISSPVLQQLFLDVRELVAVYSQVENFKEHRGSAELRWLHLQKLAVKARLVNFWVDITELNGFATPSRSSTLPIIHISSPEMCVCIAMVSFHLISFEHSSTALVWSTHLKLSISLLYACLQRLSEDLDPRLLLWIHSVGAVAEEILSTGSRPGDEKWFTDKFTALTLETNLKTEEILKTTLGTFLSSPAMSSTLRQILP